MQNKRIDDLESRELMQKVIEYAKENNLNPYKVLKEIFEKANIKISEKLLYKKHRAYRTEHEIKSGDLLTFDKTVTELEDNAIYYFSFDWDKYYIEDWGKYDAETNTIKSDLRTFELEEIEIIGKLVKIEEYKRI